ncbi:MAG: Crp/Fnr family transcriptional regulator [Treponema sp.]|jgi:CRP-like cAMP-binding protein|nr:Crp/Fnr family transcriptional regulator [Treponema sp.]
MRKKAPARETPSFLKKWAALPGDCSLFDGIDPGELCRLLDCLGARKKKYGRDSFVFMQGEEPRYFGVLLSGSLLVIQEDFWGNRNILERINPFGLFGAAFALGGCGRFPVSVTAAEDSGALLIDGGRIAASCSPSCSFHARLIRNMLGNLAKRNTALVQKLEYLSRRSTRKKLLAYLSAEALKAKSSTFTIPFKRQDLADYLAVDRSAMSSELGRMQKDGILMFAGNRFTLKRTD